MLLALRKQARAYGVQGIGARITELKRDGEGLGGGGQPASSMKALNVPVGLPEVDPLLPGLGGLEASDEQIRIWATAKTHRARPGFCEPILTTLPC